MHAAAMKWKGKKSSKIVYRSLAAANGYCSQQFFKKDVMIVGERLRKDFIYRDEKTRERLERERKKGLI